MEGLVLLTSTVLFSIFFGYTDCVPCMYPDYLRGTIWQDNRHGAPGYMAFNDSTMEGWTFTIYQQTIRNWECFVTLENNRKVVSKTVGSADLFGLNFNGYICMEFREVNGTYTYLLNSKEEPNCIYKDRIVIKTSEEIVTAASVCTPQPEDTETQTIVQIDEIPVIVVPEAEPEPIKHSPVPESHTQPSTPAKTETSNGQSATSNGQSATSNDQSADTDTDTDTDTELGTAIDGSMIQTSDASTATASHVFRMGVVMLLVVLGLHGS